MTEIGVYGGLFSVAFFAATILPAQSELGLSALLISGEYSVVLLVFFASAGNTLGAIVNWWLGQRVEKFRDRKWFPIKPRQLDKACGWYHRYGRWSLLLSWMPFIGDPLTFAAGVLREPLKSFFWIVALAKTTRYVVVACLVLLV